MSFCVQTYCSKCKGLMPVVRLDVDPITGATHVEYEKGGKVREQIRTTIKNEGSEPICDHCHLKDLLKMIEKEEADDE